MISVIILSQNFKYVVLDVPANGKLSINEKHLICGMVQNGVKVFPYGTVLSPFETYLQNETLSTEIIPHSAFMEEGRVLDFTVIELLQSTVTIPLSNSGSIVPFVPPVYYAEGLPVVYDLMLQNGGFTLETFKAWLPYNVACNAMANGQNGEQFFSITTDTFLLNQNLLGSKPITKIQDLTGVVLAAGTNSFLSQTIEYIDLPYLQTFGNNAIVAGANGNNVPNLKEFKFDTLPFFGSTMETATAFGSLGYANVALPLGVHFIVPVSMETINAGAVEPSLLHAITDRQATVTYI
jgi:hypothetical protein